MKIFKSIKLKNPIKINKNALIINASLLVLSSFILQLLSFVFRIEITRHAGTQALAVYQLILSAYNIIMAFSLQGVALAASRFSAQYLKENSKGEIIDIDKEKIKLIKSFLTKVFIICFLFIALPVFFFRSFVSEVFLGDKRCIYGLTLILICVFLTGFENINKSIFIGTKKVFSTIVSEIFELIFRIVFVIILLEINKNQNAEISAGIIVFAMIISEFWSVIYLKYKYHKNFKTDTKKIQPIKHEHYQKEKNLKNALLKTSLFVSSAGLINKIIINSNTVLIPQMLMLGGLSRENAMSDFAILFAMTIPVITLPSAIIVPVSTVIMPQISNDSATLNLTDIKRKTAKLFQLVGLAAIPLCCFFFFFSDPICQALYNNNQGAKYIFILSISMIFEYYQIAGAGILNGLGHPNIAQTSVIIEGVLQLVCTLFLVPLFHLSGYVFGNVISTIIGSLINLIAVKKYVKIKFRFTNWVIRPLFSGAISAMLTFLIYSSLSGHSGHSGHYNNTFNLIIGIISFLVFYIGILKILGTNLKKYLKDTLIKR